MASPWAVDSEISLGGSGKTVKAEAEARRERRRTMIDSTERMSAMIHRRPDREVSGFGAPQDDNETVEVSSAGWRGKARVGVGEFEVVGLAGAELNRQLPAQVDVAGADGLE